MKDAQLAIVIVWLIRCLRGDKSNILIIKSRNCMTFSKSLWSMLTMHAIIIMFEHKYQQYLFSSCRASCSSPRCFRASTNSFHEGSVTFLNQILSISLKQLWLSPGWSVFTFASSPSSMSSWIPKSSHLLATVLENGGLRMHFKVGGWDAGKIIKLLVRDRVQDLHILIDSKTWLLGCILGSPSEARALLRA